MDFNFYWAAVSKLKYIFNPQFKVRLKNNQMINHFPNHYELTRKDLLAKNLKKFKPSPRTITTATGIKMDLSNNFLPSTYLLPTEYTLFMDEF